MYLYLKRKYLLEYLCHLYSEDNLDLKGINERTKKAYTDLTNQINSTISEINSHKEEINAFNDQISEKNNQADNTNSAGSPAVEDLNYKVQKLQNNINI